MQIGYQSHVKCSLFDLQISLRRILAVTAVFLLMEAAQAIYHIRATYRHHKRRETAELHPKVDTAVTQHEEINPYPKFLHFSASDYYPKKGIMADPSGPLQNIQTFKACKSAHEHDRRVRRIRHERKRHEQRSFLGKFLRLPTEDLKSLKKFSSFPQPDASNKITPMIDTGMYTTGISRKENDMVDKLAQSKDTANDKMQKEVSLLVKYLKL